MKVVKLKMCLPTRSIGLKSIHYFHVTYHVTKGASTPHMTTDIYYGHETPFSIKLSQVRELTRSRSRDDVANMTSSDLDTVVEESAAAGQKCEFYVKHKKTPKKHHLDDSSYQKSMKKSKKSPNIISNLLRKIRSPHPLVFGLPLSEICDENFDPPESIIRLIVLVYRRGPTVPGILRRGNKASLAKEIREKIDAGVRYTIEDHQAPTAASVFKEFLRCIPGGLLVRDLHDQWLTVNKDDPVQVKLDKVKGIVAQLPPAHMRLLKLTISLLQHLAKHSAHTNMGPGNLATCIAPSFCSPSSGPTSGAGLPHGGSGGGANSASALLQVQNSVREITTVFTPLIAFMIVKHIELFGQDILSMFVKYDCEASPPIKIEEMSEEGGANGGEEEGGDGDKMASMTDSAGSNRRRESSLGDEIDEDDDDMGGEEEDEEDDDDDEEEEDYEENFGPHQAQLRRHPHSHHTDQHQTQRQRAQASSGPRDSNSGTDSDSLHSVLSMPDTGSGMGCRRDDSSLDSLVEREYFQHEEAGSSSPQAHKSHLSPSNLSRDSGLTLSDTQLYEEDVGSGMAGSPYPGEASVGRFYQRSTSSNYEVEQHHQQQQQESDDWLTRSMVDPRVFERRNEQLHPLRLGREGKKKSRESSEGSDGESGHCQGTLSPVTSVRSRPPFKHSSSTPMIDIQSRGSGKLGGPELKPCLTHPPIGKRISSDSIGEEDEGQHDHETFPSRHYQHQHQTVQPPNAIDFRQIRQNMDMGTIVKSDSGTHLFLSDDTLPTRYNLTRSQGKGSSSSQIQQHHGRVFLRQASVTDSQGSPTTPTPPTSPDVKLADSPGDNKSNSSGIFEPKPSEELSESKPAPWEPEMNSAYRNWDGQLAKNFNSYPLSLAFSKSTSDLLSQVCLEDDDDAPGDDEQDRTITVENSKPRPESPLPSPSPKVPQSPKMWVNRKSHEAEEVVDMRRRPHFSLMIRPEGDYYSQQAQQYRKRSLGLPPQHLIKGSPPPNVILQSLSGARKDVTSTSSAFPLRASYDSAILSQVRRSSATDINTHNGREIAKTINSIRPEEYISVTSRPVMISSSPVSTSEECGTTSSLHVSPVSSSSSTTSSTSSLVSPRQSLSPLSSANARRAKLAKYMGARAENISVKNQVAEGVAQRPEKPPNYHQALQRNFMLKHSVPVNITDDDTGRQRELNAKAKALYEKSLQLYNEQRINRTKEGESKLIDSDFKSNLQSKDSVIDCGDRSNGNSVQSAKGQDSGTVVEDFHTASGLSESPPSPSESGFLDLGSISQSLQTDVLSRRDKYQARSSLGMPTASSHHNPSSKESMISVPLSRHDSHLSDVSGSSSGGSTITISTLERPSDTSSGSRASMASSVASSVGGDGLAESPSKQQATTDMEFRKMSYSRHFRPQDDSEKGSIARHKEDVEQDGKRDIQWSSEGEGVYVTLRKNPQQLYLESMKLYEEKLTPSTTSQSLTPLIENRTVQSQIAHFHSQSQQQQVPSSSSSNVKDHPRPNSIHEASGLQRSQSDASNKVNLTRTAHYADQVKTSSPTQTPQKEDWVSKQPHEKQEQQRQKSAQQQQVPSSSAHSGLSDIPSEHHQNFLKARSCFYEPEETNSQHTVKPSYKVLGGTRKPTNPSHMISSSVSMSNLSTTKYENRLAPSHSQLTVDMSVESGHSPRSKFHVPLKSNQPAKTSASTFSSHVPSTSSSKSSNQGKRELPWSVKSLKSLYDKDNKESDKSGHPSQPPPYQDPPPFRRLQGAARASTSSSSSTGSEASTDPNIRKSSLTSGPLYRSGGTQAFGDGFGSYSSSEDGYSSSLDRKSRGSLDSSQEAISDHTNITYV
ncbi:rho GTPase-activating protein 20 [Plakobranchus ocellatus]|uniref:Rho GTPase-activating protein 20 n=1 Tax=Plakobranchus ocellatus TaxID=259542 RepID=A0AAV3Z6B3_9GAST|nr:rho GTPase-activating protein 20 [Plakobranchus ocellatus]